jgi:peptidoglycan hydrolase CwlO-like protein
VSHSLRTVKETHLMTNCGKILGDHLEHLIQMDWTQIEKIQQDHEEMRKQIEKQAQDLGALNALHQQLAQKVMRLEAFQEQGNSILVKANNRLRKHLQTLAENTRNAHARVCNRLSLAEKVQSAHIDRLSQAFAKSRVSA